jgi:hypothetical protein
MKTSTLNAIASILMLVVLTIPTAWAETLHSPAFDHGRWDELLARHVVPIDDDKATAVDYQGMNADRLVLKQYLQALSSISEAQFSRWPMPDQLAFLINTYNAWTVELILTAWPDLESIKDLGGLFSSPWSRKFVTVLGKTHSLDQIEHELIRGSDRYNDPRIHFAVNCASIGCPALRAEAYVGNRLDQQLEEQTRLFLSDRSRNRIEGNRVKLSSIFKWYRDDFEQGWHDFNRLEDFLLAQADALGLSTALVTALKRGKANIEFLDYDWRLNKK